MWRRFPLILLSMMPWLVPAALGQHQAVAVVLDLKLIEGAGLPPEEDLRTVVELISHRSASGATIHTRQVDSITAADPENRTAVLWMRLGIPSSVNPFTEANEFAEFERAAADQLKKLATSDANLSPEQRAARFKEVNARLATIPEKIKALQTLVEARGDDRELLKKRFEQLRETHQQLELQKGAKEARKVALREGLARLEKEARARAQDDPITAELRKLVALREEGYARVKQLNEVADAGHGDLTTAETALAEAKIRLAEREAALARGGKGDLLERLSDELAMVSVDLIELDIQLEHIRGQLSAYDANPSDLKQLDDLLFRNPQLDAAGAANLRALWQELEHQYRQLQRERFALMVEDVTLQAPPQPQ